MSGQANLLIDIGNTKVKYASYMLGDPMRDINVMHASLGDLVPLALCAKHIYICNVKSDSVLTEFLLKLKSINHKITIATTQDETFGIKNSYGDITKMGVDRWMCMLACKALGSDNFLVFHAGTAITCDAVVGSRHLGGWICAGLTMSRITVAKNTDRVVDKQNAPTTLMFGNDTSECVAHGALAQLVGLVLSGSERFSFECEEYTLYIGGGDGCLLHNNLPPRLLAKSEYFENLVLIGLAWMANNAAGLS